MKNKFLMLSIIGVVLLYCLFLLSPLFKEGFFPMHDDTQVVRVHQMTKALSHGMFPVRWVSDLGYGYGYPIFNFYAPFAYYVGSGFDLVGFDELVSTKIMFGLSLCILGVGMYLLSSRVFGKTGGIISAILAVSSPYIALNLYVRGAMSELYGLMWIPLIFYAIIQIITTKQYRYVILGSLSFAAMILSHNLTALMVTPSIILALGIFFVRTLVKKQRLLSVYIFSTILIGILVSSFYWIPAIFEINYTNVRSQVGGGADFRDHFVCITQLWESQWGYGGSALGCVDGLSFRLGKLHIILILLVFPLIFLTKTRIVRYAFIGSFLIFFVSLFLSLPFSQFVWEMITPMEFIQYPWRFLGLMSLSASFLAGALVIYPRLFLKNFKFKQVAIGIMIVFTFVGSIALYPKLFRPQLILDVDSNDYVNLDNIHFRTSKISDEYLPSEFKKPQELRFIPTTPMTLIAGNTTFITKSVTTDYIMVDAYAHIPSTVRINTAYFPTWHVFVNGQEVIYKKDGMGMVIDIPEGNHIVEVVFQSTKVQILGNILSLVGILILIVGIISRKKRREL